MSLIIFIVFCVGLYHTCKWLKKQARKYFADDIKNVVNRW